MSAPAPIPLRPGRSLPGLVAGLALWPFLEQVLSFLVGFVDTALAGRLSVEATNAVGAGAYVLWLIGMLHGAIGVGAAALVARHTGAGRRGDAVSAMAQALLLALVAGVGVGGLLWLSAPSLAWMTGLRGESADLCVIYLRVLALSGPFHAVLFVAAACLRAAGEMRQPFRVMVVVNLINAAASILFVAGPEPIGGHGITGLAVGTLLAWAAGAVWIVRILIRWIGWTPGQTAGLRPKRDLMRRIARIGLPNLGESIGLWAGNFAVLVMVGHLADRAAVGAHIVAIRIEALSFLPGVALGTAAATLAGQFLGAGDPVNARRAVWICFGYGAVFMGVMGAGFILLPELLVRLISNQQPILEAAPPLLFIVGWVQVGFAASLIFSGALRGVGDTRACMAITFGSTYLLRVPLVWWIAVHLGHGLNGVWIALSVELMARGLFFLLRFLHGGWTRVIV